MVLYDQLFSPRKIVAIDHSPEPVKPLETYISRRHKRDVVKPFYGVNQADRTVMEAILAREFPGRDLNLIVDDASHFYAEARDAFNISFPYLAPGGHYVIEDWAWAHWAGDTWQREQVAALASDDRVVRSGISAASDLGGSLLDSAREFEGYVREADFPALVRQVRLEPAPLGEHGRILLRIPRPDWPFLPAAEVAPRAVVAVDLSESHDPRGRSAADELIHRA